MSPHILYQCDIQRKGANEMTFATLFEKSQNVTKGHCCISSGSRVKKKKL